MQYVGKISKIGLKNKNEIVWSDAQGLSIQESTNTENTRCMSVSKSSEIQNTHPSFRVVEDKIYHIIYYIDNIYIYII